MVRIHGHRDIKSGIRALRQHGGQPQQQQRTHLGNLRYEGNIVLYNEPTKRAISVFSKRKEFIISTRRQRTSRRRHGNFSFNVIITKTHTTMMYPPPFLYYNGIPLHQISIHRAWNFGKVCSLLLIISHISLKFANFPVQFVPLYL